MSQAIESLSIRASLYMEAGDWGSARECWLEALAIAPDSGDIMLELSYIESFFGRYRSAHDWGLRAARAKLSSGDTVRSLLSRLCNFNEGRLIRAMAVRFLADSRAPHIVLLECVRHLNVLGDFDLAMRCAESAIAKAPNSSHARLVRGQLLAQQGKVKDAVQDIEWVVAREPRIPTAWWMLARLQKQTIESNHISKIRDLIEDPDLDFEGVAALARALHKELDDIGDHEGAWGALDRLCSAMRSRMQYSITATRDLVEALIGCPLGNAATPLPGSGAKTPIFIVGMHRSGTTLLEQLLDASPYVKGLGELYDFTAALRHAADHQCPVPLDETIVARLSSAKLEELGQYYLDGIAWRLKSETHFIDKQPANFFNVGFILRSLPGAKVLHMVRDPMETCFSNLRELFSDANRYSYDQIELAEYYLEYRRLMAHWRRYFPNRILDVDYERLTSDPGAVMREVADFCGIDYVDGMRSTASSKRMVATASSIQVREEVASLNRPKWFPYARHLQPMQRVLRDGGVYFRGLEGC